MKRVKYRLLFISLILVTTAFTGIEKGNKETNTYPVEIKWYSMEEAMELNKENPKKIFIDVYTDWCGWCKKMDASTFMDPEVVEVLNDKFYSVKFDAEQKEDLEFQKTIFKFDTKLGRRGAHQFAYELLNKRMSYPSYVYLDKDLNRITISPGFKEVEQIMTELRYIGGDLYTDMTFVEYQESLKK